MNLTPSEIAELRRARLASSISASKMTLAEVAEQVSLSGCEWKLNPQWNGIKQQGLARFIPRIRLEPTRVLRLDASTESSSTTKPD